MQKLGENVLRKVFFLVIISFLQPLCYAGEIYPPKGYKVVCTEKSPRSSYEIVLYKEDPDDFSSESQIWIHAYKNGFKTQLLFTHNNRAWWIISPDEKLIAINYHACNTDGLLHIFSLSKEGRFVEIKKDFRELATQLAFAQHKRKIPLGHHYCYADSWLRNRYLLGRVFGHESESEYLDEWYFIYDTQTDRFLFDLKSLNQEAFPPHQKNPKSHALRSE